MENQRTPSGLRGQVLGTKLQTHSWLFWRMKMCIELHISSCSATNRGAKKILPRASPFFEVHRITFQWEITHLYKLHCPASLQALNLSGDRIANVSHLRFCRPRCYYDCKNSSVRRLDVFQWHMCIRSVVKVSKLVQKHNIDKQRHRAYSLINSMQQQSFLRYW